MDEIILNKVRKHIEDIFRQKSTNDPYYHNFNHTAEVVKVIEEISNALDISEEDKECLLIAGWFHDIGYIECHYEHEDSGIEIAKDFLKKNKFPDNKIQKVVTLINVTRMPRNPHNLLEEIMCDADLHHVGTDQFGKREKLFREELECIRNCKISDKEWLENNIAFLKRHKFFTSYAKKKFEDQKIINLKKIQEELGNLSEK